MMEDGPSPSECPLKRFRITRAQPSHVEQLSQMHSFYLASKLLCKIADPPVQVKGHLNSRYATRGNLQVQLSAF
jgi:hypothetical protein